MAEAVKRAWLAYWVSVVTAMLAGVTAIVNTVTKSLWYLPFVVVDFAAAALITWSIIQLRRAHEHAAREQAERATVVRQYLDTVQRPPDQS